MSRPKVSVVCLTYNQEKYIGEAIDSFLLQQTDFEFEIIVADDRSTDKTADIIKAYAHQHPDKLKTLLRKKNIGVAQNFYDAMSKASGEYIALCEGDDYWTDPAKLQLQADFLDSHPKYAICFHPVRVFFEGGGGKEYIYPESKNENDFSLKRLLEKNYIQTNSVMYRKQNYKEMPPNILPVDWYLHLYHAQFGKIGFINKTMADYRRHPGGIWWESDRNRDELYKKHGLAQLRLYQGFLKLYGDKTEYREIIKQQMLNLLNNLIEVDRKYKSALFEQALLTVPESAASAAVLVVNKQAEIERQDDLLKDLENKNEHQENLLKQKNEEIQLIKSSRLWKLRNLVARAIGKGVV